MFTATIWPHPSFAGSSIPPFRQSGGVSGGVNGGVGDLGRGNVARRRQAVLGELTSAGELSARELSERLEVGSRMLERDLTVLREAGRVLREGPPKTSKRDMRCFGWETTTPVARTKVSVSPVKEPGCSSQRIRNGSQQSAEIADGLLVARDSSAGSQHPRRIAAG